MKKILFAALAPFLLVLVLIFSIILMSDDEESGRDDSIATVGLSPEVLAYRPLVERYCKLYGISDCVNYILAIMQVESGGRGNDVMQCSESLGLPLNSLMPEPSIRRGCEYFSILKGSAGTSGCDIDSVIQSYNYGGGYIPYVAGKGKKHTFALAESFSKEKSGGKKVDYPNPVAVAKNGGWRYNYGNMFYVELVRSYLNVAVTDGFGGAVIDEALKYQGRPYVWGGSSPSESFDCSGLTQWCYKAAGANLPRTAQAQYDAMKHIPVSKAQPGDLVFFTGTYATSDYITHVGIFVGNNRMFHAGDPIGYSDLSYWGNSLVCAGTIR